MLDTGSQRSYISSAAARSLQIPLTECNTKLTVNTFINTAVKSFLELGMTIDMQENTGSFSLPVLIDDDFQLEFEVSGLREAVGNIAAKHDLAE